MLFFLLQLQLFSQVDNTIEGLGYQGAQVKRKLAEQKRAPTGPCHVTRCLFMVEGLIDCLGKLGGSGHLIYLALGHRFIRADLRDRPGAATKAWFEDPQFLDSNFGEPVLGTHLASLRPDICQGLGHESSQDYHLTARLRFDIQNVQPSLIVSTSTLLVPSLTKCRHLLDLPHPKPKHSAIKLLRCVFNDS